MTCWRLNGVQYYIKHYTIKEHFVIIRITLVDLLGALHHSSGTVVVPRGLTPSVGCFLDWVMVASFFSQH